jgi:hypothetical protein
MHPLRIILHAGMHKTGTTSIQNALYNGRDALRAEGILYPQTGCPDWARQGHHLLPWSLIRRPGIVPVFRGRVVQYDRAGCDDLWQQLRAEIAASGAHTVVLSSEEFDGLTNEEIVTLRGYLRGYDIQPVLAVRNHVDFIESMYKTSVLYHEYTDTIEQFVANGVRARMDVTAMCTAWGALAQDGVPILLAYDDPAVRRDMVAVFMHAAGLGTVSLGATQAWHNPSYPAFLYEIARFMRLSGRSEPEIDRFVVQTALAAWRHPPTHAYVFMNAQVRGFVAWRYEQQRQQLLALPKMQAAFAGALPPPYQMPDAEKTLQIADHFDALQALAREVQPGKDISWPRAELAEAACPA